MDFHYEYHQLKIKVDEVLKTAFGIRHDHYEFFVMSFGLINARVAFMDIMDIIFKYL